MVSINSNKANAATVPLLKKKKKKKTECTIERDTAQILTSNILASFEKPSLQCNSVLLIFEKVQRF